MTEKKWIKMRKGSFTTFNRADYGEFFFERIKVVLLMLKNKPLSKIKGTSLLRKYLYIFWLEVNIVRKFV